MSQHYKRTKNLLGGQNPNRTLDASFYNCPEIWHLENKTIFQRGWRYIAHTSEFNETRNCLVKHLGESSVLLVQKRSGEVNCFANSCIHRGSELLDCHSFLENGRIVCPYHGWKYDENGKLISRRGNIPKVPETGDLGLNKLALSILNGLIFVRPLGTDVDILPLDAFSINTKPFLELHGFESAEVLSKKMYRVLANWKLVVDNFRECLHCVTAHAAYCGVYEYPAIYEQFGPDECVRRTLEWGKTESAVPELAGLHNWEGDFNPLKQPHYAMRRQIGDGKQTLTRRGIPVSKLMGKFKKYDGGDTVVNLHPFFSIWAANDYTVFIRFNPLRAQETEVELVWLVHPEATLNQNSISDIEWLWNTTMLEDIELIERTQRGINSSFYRPGFFTPQEQSLAWANKWYLDAIQHDW